MITRYLDDGIHGEQFGLSPSDRERNYALESIGQALDGIEGTIQSMLYRIDNLEQASLGPFPPPVERRDPDRTSFGVCEDWGYCNSF